MISEHVRIALGLSVFQNGRTSVNRISTKSMSLICILWRLIVAHRDYPESSEWFLCQDNADVSNTVRKFICLVPEYS